MQFVHYTTLLQALTGKLSSYLHASVLLIKRACMQTQMLSHKLLAVVCCEAKVRILCNKRPQICSKANILNQVPLNQPPWNAVSQTY